MIESTLFVLAVPDLEASSNFYREVLGFQIRELGGPGWLMYEQGHCKIMVGECPEALPVGEIGDHSYFSYLVVDDVNSYYERVISLNVEITKKIRDEPWGMREFGLRTIDGHRIMIGSMRSE